MIGSAVVLAARGMVGTPFRHQGRVPGEALDCAGLAVCAACACGLPAIDLHGYGRRPTFGELEAHLDRQPALRRVMREAQAGDLLLMCFSREPQHVAICAGETLIHAYESVGKVCEHGFTDEWKARIVRVYEFVEVTA
jgi:cell wall-associated NlpC family hydrolase